MMMDSKRGRKVLTIRLFTESLAIMQGKSVSQANLKSGKVRSNLLIAIGSDWDRRLSWVKIQVALREHAHKYGRAR